MVELSLLAKKVLRDVPSDCAFWMCNGVISKNIYELLSNIRFLSKYAFIYHVNSKNNKNDFADWIRDVLGDEELANNLQHVYDKQKYVDIIQKRIWCFNADCLSGDASESESDLLVLREKVLSDVPHSKVFWSCNHVHSMNIHELLNNIRGLSEKDFSYHVNAVNKKNDFAKWILNVLGDEELALRLSGVYDKQKYVDIIQQRICFLENLINNI